MPTHTTFGQIGVTVSGFTRIAALVALPSYTDADWSGALAHLAERGYVLDDWPVEVRDDGTECYIGAVPGDDADLTRVGADWAAFAAQVESGQVSA